MLGSLLTLVLGLLMTGGIYLYEQVVFGEWRAECLKLLAEVPDLHPAEAARRARKLLSEKPQELF